jgi:fibronectin-binding autotransporter adhesin
MPNNPTEASLVDINAITQIASVRTIKTSEAIGVASLDTAQTFGTLQSFSTGISASALTVGGGGATFASNASFSSTTNHTGLATFAGGITSSSLSIGGGATFSGNVAMTSTSSHTGLASFAGGITSSSLWIGGGATFSGNISAPNIVNSVNGLTGSVKIPRSLSVYAPTTSDSITLFYTPVALTISRISAVLRGSSTPSVTYNLNYGTDRSSGTLVFTSGTTVTSTTTATVVTSFNNSSIPAGGLLWLTASAVSGTVDELSVSVEF